MPLSPLLAGRGGRQAPSGIAPPLGSFVYVLGSEQGETRTLVGGDFVEVHQLADVDGIRFIRVPAHVIWRDPGGSFVWTLSLVLDGGSSAIEIPLTRTQPLGDLAIPIGAMTGAHDIGIRLTLTGAGDPASMPMPAVYLDALALDETSTGLALLNRTPGPGDEDVPVNTNIQLDLVDLAGTDPIVAATTQVLVNGIVAYAGGVFQPGFDGPDSGDDNLIAGGFGLRITIDPTNLFASEQSVEVRVVSTQANGAIDSTYTFDIEDTSLPMLEAAFAIERREVRVTFSEPVGALALDPANWSIGIASTSIENGLPAVALAVVGVQQETDLTFVLTTNIEMTRGAIYQAIVENVADLSGNVVAAPSNTALFVGYTCASPGGRDLDLLSLVPLMNMEEDETQDLRRFLLCLQEVVDLLLCDVDRWVEIFDADRAPERFVDALLYDLGNPFSFVDLTTTDKRRLALVLVAIYRQKGTADGIINAIRFFLGIEVTLSYPAFDGVWILGSDELGIGTYLGSDEAGSRYSYRIDSPVILTDEQRTLMRRLATYMHVAHEHLIEIREPAPPPEEPDHWELGYSELGTETLLH